MKTFFTYAFADDSDLNIGYLARYTFVLSLPLGECTKAYLQTLLYRQKLFHKNIQYFMVTGLQNIDQPHQLESNIHQVDPQVEPDQQEAVDLAGEAKMDTSAGNNNNDQASLRYYLY